MNDIVRRSRVLAACVAVALLTVAPAVAQDDLEDWQRAELRSMLEAIEAAIDGRIVPTGDPFGFRADFLKGTDGNAYVPFTLSIDPDRVDAPSLSMYLYVVEPGDDDPIFEDAYFADVTSGGDEPIRLSRAFAAPGGAYDVYIVLRESSRDLAPESDPPGDRDRARIDEYCGGLFADDLSSRFACQEQEYLAYRLQRRPRLSYDGGEDSASMLLLPARVDVPDLWDGRLQLSTIILPEVVEPLAAAADTRRADSQPVQPRRHPHRAEVRSGVRQAGGAVVDLPRLQSGAGRVSRSPTSRSSTPSTSDRKDARSTSTGRTRRTSTARRCRPAST